MEPDAKVVENYNTEFENGRVWATRVYTTTVAADKIKGDYETYFKSLSGWTISKIYYRENQTFMAASREQESLVIIIADKKKQNINSSSVTISYQRFK